MSPYQRALYQDTYRAQGRSGKVLSLAILYRKRRQGGQLSRLLRLLLLLLSPYTFLGNHLREDVHYTV
jgi:hypothetical protein